MNEADAPDRQLAASLLCARLAFPGPQLVERTRGAAMAAMADSLRLPPLGLLADIVCLLQQPEPQTTGPEVPGLDLRRYADRVVSPLVDHRLRMRLFDAACELGPSWTARAAAVLGDRLVRDLEGPQGGRWHAGELRRWLARSSSEALDLGLSALDDPAVREALADRLRTISERGAAGLSEADIHLVRYLPAMPLPHQRLAVEHVIGAGTDLELSLPQRVTPRKRVGPVVSQVADEDRYPVGGFSALTTSGSPENLVASELVYMEDGGDIDLFDVRFAEGELLYYTRDESIHLRGHRSIHVVLHEDLVAARVKDADLPWQRIVGLLGVLRAVLERVSSWLGDRELEIVVHPALPALDEEAGILQLALRSLLDAGVLRVEPLNSLDELDARLVPAHPSDEVDVIWISAGAAAPPLDAPSWSLLVGQQGLVWPGSAPAPDLLQQWKAASEAMARWLA